MIDFRNVRTLLDNSAEGPQNAHFLQLQLTQNGLPQCFSPVSFDVYTFILHTIADASTAIFQFTDDFLIISSSNTRKLSASNLQLKVNQYVSLCNRSAPSNIGECSTIRLVKHQKKGFSIRVGDQMTSHTSPIKFLERTITSFLTIKLHVAIP